MAENTTGSSYGEIEDRFDSPIPGDGLNHANNAIQRVLIVKSWFGFDLDDTLHEFRKASNSATIETLQYIARKTAHAFADGKTSEHYRKERFEAVLQELGLPAPEGLLNQLVEMYKRTLESSLARKTGAMSLLTYLKSIGKKITIITEGPQDAQVWTIEKLELAQFVDFLATTNYFGVPEIDGSFPKVLEKLGIKASDMVYVGDNEIRDVKPAIHCRMFAIHYSEKEEFFLDSTMMKINTLEKLEHILRGT